MKTACSSDHYQRALELLGQSLAQMQAAQLPPEVVFQALADTATYGALRLEGVKGVKVLTRRMIELSVELTAPPPRPKGAWD